MNSEMTLWEYRYIYLKSSTNSDQIELMLDEMGSDGWELINVISAGGGLGRDAVIHSYIFKRPIG